MIRHTNKTKKYFYVIFASFFISSFYPINLLAQNAASSTVDQLNAQKSDMQKKLDELNKQIKSYTLQIAQTREKSSTLQNEISIYEKEMLVLELQIQAKETQIQDKTLQIQEIEKMIQEKTQQIAENRVLLGELLFQVEKYDREYLLRTTLSSENLSEFLDSVQYNKNFQNKIFQVLEQIKTLKIKMEAQQNELKIQLKTMQELKEQLEISQSDLALQRNQKQSLLNKTRGLERNYQNLLAVSKKEESNIQKEIDDLDAKIREKLGTRAIKGTSGVLAWPMDGVLTQKYGKTGFTALGYNSHNGIDIAAPAGQPIYAAADGTVIYTDYSDAAYGNWVAIKHSLTGSSGQVNIITLYAHMRTIKVKPGQVVKQGDLVGYEGNTGNTTKKLYGPERGYHIHFGVYDVEGFGVQKGQYSSIYGSYLIPYGYTYDPMNFLQK